MKWDRYTIVGIALFSMVLPAIAFVPKSMIVGSLPLEAQLCPVHVLYQAVYPGGVRLTTSGFMECSRRILSRIPENVDLDAISADDVLKCDWSAQTLLGFVLPRFFDERDKCTITSPRKRDPRHPANSPTAATRERARAIEPFHF